jgi:hypothetical protein
VAAARAELFHRIPETDSAATRRRASELGLLDGLELRNVEFDSHRAALAAHGGGVTPALWDGAQLHVGRDAVLAALELLARRKASDRM